MWMKETEERGDNRQIARWTFFFVLFLLFASRSAAVAWISSSESGLGGGGHLGPLPAPTLTTLVAPWGGRGLSHGGGMVSWESKPSPPPSTDTPTLVSTSPKEHLPYYFKTLPYVWNLYIIEWYRGTTTSQPFKRLEPPFKDYCHYDHSFLEYLTTFRGYKKIYNFCMLGKTLNSTRSDCQGNF